MRSKSLIISFGEVLRITEKEGKVEYLICDDDVAMRMVDRNEFEDFMKTLENVCMSSWNKALATKYEEIVRFFYMVEGE